MKDYDILLCNQEDMGTVLSLLNEWGYSAYQTDEDIIKAFIDEDGIHKLYATYLIEEVIEI